MQPKDKHYANHIIPKLKMSLGILVPHSKVKDLGSSPTSASNSIFY